MADNEETGFKVNSMHDSLLNWCEPMENLFCKVDFMDWQYIDIINDIVTLVFIYGVNKGDFGSFILFTTVIQTTGCSFVNVLKPQWIMCR